QGPLDFFKKIGEGIKQDYVGKYNSEGLAYVIGCGTFDIMTIFLGFTKLGKLGKLGEFAEETTKGAKVTEGVEGAVDVAKINRLLEVDKFLDEYVPKQYQNQIKSAFEDDIKVTTLDEDKVVYRYYGGKAGASSYWVSPTKVKDPIADLALPPGNTAENMDQVILPKGTKVLEGTVAPNFGQPGGGYQYYVPDIKTIGG
ncbi:MAG: TNT domain-containing protein, partial [Clostridiales bacterium]|nr:TNT domain-containing protein [Clostridiales bacterium]